MDDELTFPCLKGEKWRLIFGTGSEYLISNLGRLARCDGMKYHLWEIDKNLDGEFGLNLEILVHSEYIKKGTFKFYQMQRLMALIWLHEGEGDFVVTKRDKKNSNWQLDNLKISYRLKVGKFQGRDFTFWRKISECEKGFDITADIV